MKQPAMILTVRVKTALPPDEVSRIVEERADDFRAFPGLQQKYYVQDPVSAEYGGIYLWESPEALVAYRESELRASIAKAYQAVGEPRVEVYKVLKVLRDESA